MRMGVIREDYINWNVTSVPSAFILSFYRQEAHKENASILFNQVFQK